MKYLEEYLPGETRIIGSHTFTAEAIKAFASRYDPQAFHLDEEAARHSIFGGLCASGWHTAAIWMQTYLAWVERCRAERVAAGLPVARTGPSPGFTDLRWLLPVFPGDTITYRNEVLETRPSASRPQWGLLTVRHIGDNQHGRRAFEFVGKVFIERRPAEGTP